MNLAASIFAIFFAFVWSILVTIVCFRKIRSYVVAFAVSVVIVIGTTIYIGIKAYGGLTIEAVTLIRKGLIAMPILNALVGAFIAINRWIDRDKMGNRCHVCSYDLTGNTSGVCPECGSPVDGDHTIESHQSDS